MGRLIDRLADRRTSAALAWASVLALLVATAAFLAVGEPDWAAFALLLAGVAVVPPAIERDPAVTLPGELVALAAVPVLVRLTGAFEQATPFLAAAGLALLAAVVLEAYSSLSMTPRFLVVFTVVTTLAFAGAWTVGIWISDTLFATAFLAGQVELMWDLVTAAAMGVLAGVVFEVYFKYTHRLDALHDRPTVELAGRGRSGSRPESPATGVHSVDSASTDSYSTDSLSGDSRYLLAIRGMQLVLVGVVALSVVRADWSLLVNSAVPLGVTALPGLLRREYDYPTNAGLVLWVTLAATLHTVGALGPYQTFGWYDSLTHTVSATLVAGVGYTVARAAELHTDDVSFQPAFRSTFVLLFVLAVGVLWEILEFGSGGAAALVGGEAVLAQYGVGDIAKDIVFDSVGGVLAAAWATGRFDPIARVVAGRVGVLVRGE